MIAFEACKTREMGQDSNLRPLNSENLALSMSQMEATELYGVFSIFILTIILTTVS